MTRDSGPRPGEAAALPLLTLVVLSCGLAFRAGPHAVWGERVLWWGLLVTGLPVVWRTIVGLFRGRYAADVVATLAVITALALHQSLPGLVVVLMQTGGEALEHYAAGRASRAVAELEAAAPRQANRLVGGQVEQISASVVEVGDLLLVRPGEMIPCDGEVLEGRSHVDLSRLTGEPVPPSVGPGAKLPSGGLNLDGPLELRAIRAANESQYARIVELVRQAQASKSPLQRLADRAAVVFTPLTLVVSGLAWLASDDPTRVLAVLVVASPCPLILAAPVAMIGGISRAARRGVVIRHGEALERLGTATVAMLDKTGTLTVGRPMVRLVTPIGGFREAEVLQLAASIESGSGHLLARSVVTEAASRGLSLMPARQLVEAPGEGMTGTVDGRTVRIGSWQFIRRESPRAETGFGPPDGRLRAWVTIDGAAAGTIEFADQVRPEARQLAERLTALGFRRILLLTGDHPGSASRVGAELGITEIHADLLPGDKVRLVETLETTGERVLMAGDGTNDAPALSRASVGIALAAHGGGITAESADVVVLADQPGLIADAVAIGRSTVRIARQSVGAGMALSGLAMLVAALGYIPPTVGALLQEGMDVAVILYALRASVEPRVTAGPPGRSRPEELAWHQST